MARPTDEYTALVLYSACARVDGDVRRAAYRVDVAYAAGLITREQHTELLGDLGVRQ